MEKYNFKLQKLLDIRVDKEEESKRQFKEAQRAKNKVEQKLSDLEESYKRYNVKNIKESVIEQKIKQNYLNAVNLSIHKTNIELEDKNRILEEERKVLKEKQIERKTVEVLKEKQQAAFFKEQELIEQKTNDEFALYAFVRRHERR